MLDIENQALAGGSDHALRMVPSEDEPHPAHIHAAPTSSTGNISDDDIEDSGTEDDETAGLTGRKRKSSTSGFPLGRRRTIADAPNQPRDRRASSELGRSLRRHSATVDDYGEHSLLFPALYSSGILLKKRIISLYVQLCELKSYVQLNRTGFRKVLKKFDKILDKDLKTKYMSEHVFPAYPFRDDTKNVLDQNIKKMEAAYAEVVTGGDRELAKKDLRSHLREHVVWERNTVWRDLIGIERRGEAARLGQTLLGQDPTFAATKRLQGDEAPTVEPKRISTPLGRFSLPPWLFNSSVLTLVACVTIFLVILFVPMMEKPEQQDCLALLVFVSLLWATEVRLTPQKSVF